jgi:hypothetical protein
MRKTFEIERIKTFVNEQLANDGNTLDEKQGMICVLEHVLMRSDSYKGFMFLDAGGESIGPPGTPKHVRRKYF